MIIGILFIIIGFAMLGWCVCAAVSGDLGILEVFMAAVSIPLLSVGLYLTAQNIKSEAPSNPAIEQNSNCCKCNCNIQTPKLEK